MDNLEHSIKTFLEKVINEVKNQSRSWYFNKELEQEIVYNSILEKRIQATRHKANSISEDSYIQILKQTSSKSILKDLDLQETPPSNVTKDILLHHLMQEKLIGLICKLNIELILNAHCMKSIFETQKHYMMLHAKGIIIDFLQEKFESNQFTNSIMTALKYPEHQKILIDNFNAYLIYLDPSHKSLLDDIEVFGIVKTQENNLIRTANPTEATLLKKKEIIESLFLESHTESFMRQLQNPSNQIPKIFSTAQLAVFLQEAMHSRANIKNCIYKFLHTASQNLSINETIIESTHFTAFNNR